MLTGCPVCEESFREGATACTSCGLPVALAADAVKALSVPVSTLPGPTPAAPEVASPPVPDPQVALCDRLARQIDREIGTLVDLGGDPLSVASDLRQAALSEADGHVVEALGILRQASGRVVLLIEELFESRLAEVQRRVDRLRASGVGVVVDAPLERIQGAVRAGERPPALKELLQLDERITRLEGDFTGLRGILQEIDGLRAALHNFAEAPAEVDADVERVRTLLATPELTPAILDEASQTAARAMMLLHETLPPHLETELGRHAAWLGRYPDDHAGARSARTIHADAVRHLRRGRLTEASARLVELRRTIDEMRRAPPAPAPAPPAPTSPEVAAAPDPDIALKNLLAKARGLAARVRRLPAESELAFEAASAIRQATELLRSRKLDEADQALTRLMQTLSSEPVGEV